MSERLRKAKIELTCLSLFIDLLNIINSPENEITGFPSLLQSIFEILSELNAKPKALVLDWSFGAKQLFNCFAKLLAHPLQRPIQCNMEHKLLTT